MVRQDSSFERPQHMFNSLPPGKFFMLFLSSADFFQNQLFRKILSEVPSECQTD